jgi:glycogen debranching enzyme
MAEPEERVTMTRSQHTEFIRNYLDHADQARDYWQKYEKAKFAMLRIADDIECEHPCHRWVDEIRNTFKP